MQNPIVSKILALADRGQSADAIAAAVERSAGYVYSVLREHRPDRPRKVHKTRSDLPRKIAALHLAGKETVAIAEKLAVSRAYVYRHLPRGREGAILPPCPVRL
jgi:transposase